jgi:hypothetical protein
VALALSEPGSSGCKLKVACTENDYYEYQTSCDKDNKVSAIVVYVLQASCLSNSPIISFIPVTPDLFTLPGEAGTSCYTNAMKLSAL